MNLARIALIVCLLCAPTSAALDGPEPGPSRMTQARLVEVLRGLAPQVQGRANALSFEFSGVRIECISDAPNDRMRLVAVIAPVSKLTPEQIAHILEANFHSALDARYGTSDGYLFAAFIHPLSPLTEGEIHSAVTQVASLVRTFGTTYSSGALVFGGGAAPI